MKPVANVFLTNVSAKKDSSEKNVKHRNSNVKMIQSAIMRNVILKVGDVNVD